MNVERGKRDGRKRQIKEQRQDCEANGKAKQKSRESEKGLRGGDAGSCEKGRMKNTWRGSRDEEKILVKGKLALEGEGGGAERTRGEEQRSNKGKQYKKEAKIPKGRSVSVGGGAVRELAELQRSEIHSRYSDTNNGELIDN